MNLLFAIESPYGENQRGNDLLDSKLIQLLFNTQARAKIAKRHVEIRQMFGKLRKLRKGLFDAH